MQINFVLPAMGNSGGIDVVYKYATLLREEGHTVTIYKEIIEICIDINQESKIGCIVYIVL